MGTKILTCTCAHAFQDERHGKGRRVHNPCGKDGKTLRCTVCCKQADTNKDKK